MKTPHKRLLITLLLAITALLVIGGSICIKRQKHMETPGAGETITQPNKNARTQPVPNDQLSQSVQTSTATGSTGWKTYQNRKYGFEFQYPASLSLVIGLSDGLIFLSTGDVGMSMYPFAIDFAAATSTSLQEWFGFANHGECAFDNDIPLALLNLKPTDYFACTTPITGGDEPPERNYVFRLSGLNVDLDYEMDNAGNAIIANEILSTFKLRK
jgi:hypothetical protein